VYKVACRNSVRNLPIFLPAAVAGSADPTTRPDSLVAAVAAAAAVQSLLEEQLHPACASS
jgi:hypothetical protein